MLHSKFECPAEKSWVCRWCFIMKLMCSLYCICTKGCIWVFMPTRECRLH
uniref:Uncharacterized protein n=1 Tax=Arundo donax TaxID=35708 RepID=A0A0A8XS85_ARUDO